MNNECMLYIFETNRMLKMFNNYDKFQIFKKTLDEIDRTGFKHYIGEILCGFNSALDFLEDYIKNNVDEKYHYKVYDLFFEIYMNRIIYMCIHVDSKGNLQQINIYEQYKEKYCNKIQEDILSYWSESKYKDIFSKDRTFIRMFDEIHDSALTNFKDIFIKKGHNLKTLYRCQKGNHYGNYIRMIPDKHYCTDCRWNEDHIPYLYLGCSFKKENSGFNNVIKTCFREVRLKNDEQATVCKFRWIDDNVKLFNLCIDDEACLKEKKLIDKRLNQEINQIKNDEDLINRIVNLRKENKNDEIERIVRIKARNLSDKRLITRMVASDLINIIVKAIFEPVDGQIEKYIPFRVFAEYLKKKGYQGIIYKSTQMEKYSESGINVVLFDTQYATYEKDSMEIYKCTGDEFIKIR